MPKNIYDSNADLVMNQLKDGYTFTRNDLKYLQLLPLERKVQKTHNKIFEWCCKWDWNVYVSFSGGKDSTVLLHMMQFIAKRMKKKIPAVFVDTGLEYPEIREFVKTFSNVTWLKPKRPFSAIIRDYGYPVISKDVSQAIQGARKGWPSSLRKLDGLNPDGSLSKYITSKYCKYKYLLDAPFKISDSCCSELKKNPIRDYEKETGRKCITAQMASESNMRRESYLRHGCNAYQSTRPISNPMGFWTDQDVMEYLQSFDVPYCSVYGEFEKDKKGKYRATNLDRTGCIFCMFGVHCEKKPNRFQRLKETHPKLYTYCMNRLGCGQVLDFIGIDR